nr:MAG TPA: hypothetical protein [Caudoviricetes sp.]
MSCISRCVYFCTSIYNIYPVRKFLSKLAFPLFL